MTIKTACYLYNGSADGSRKKQIHGIRSGKQSKLFNY